MLSISDLILNSLDYILLVDSNYKIVFNTRYDPRTSVSHELRRQDDVFNKCFFDIYPQLERAESSVVRCMTTGQVVACKHQSYTDCWGNHYLTDNITLPIRRLGQVVAVAELVQDAAPNGDRARSKRFDRLVERIQRESGQMDFDAILTRNPELRRSIQTAKLLSGLPNPTLIYGETGTGKELFAQAMITHSGAPQNKVVVHNCAATPESLMESILFGTEKGAYTGAEHRVGLFQEADGGVLFLDEMSSMPYEVQAKLLRVLQDGTFRPLGAGKVRRVSVKVICAMNIDPVEAMERGTLRRDLFYRLSSSMIRLPPLRERREDIGLYLDHFLRQFCQLYSKQVSGFTSALRRALEGCDWGGNVRELKNAVDHMVSLAPWNATLDLPQLPDYLRGQLDPASSRAEAQATARAAELLHRASIPCDLQTEDGPIPYDRILEQVSRSLITEALDRCNHNKAQAAALLGIPRKTLQYRMEKLGLDGANP